MNKNGKVTSYPMVVESTNTREFSLSLPFPSIPNQRREADNPTLSAHNVWNYQLPRHVYGSRQLNFKHVNTC